MSNYKFSDHQKVLTDIDRLGSCSYFTFAPVRKKRKTNLFKFSVRDGYMTMNVELYPKVSCPCMSSSSSIRYIYCRHVLRIMMAYFGLSSYVITYFHLPEISTKFHDLIESNEKIESINDELTKALKDHFSHECGICAEELHSTKFDMNLYQCNRCGKYVHSRCMQNWNHKRLEPKNHKKEPPPENGCIYCREKVT